MDLKDFVAMRSKLADHLRKIYSDFDPATESFDKLSEQIIFWLDEQAII